jgi:hypothetical protein
MQRTYCPEIDRRKSELVRAGAGVEPFLREDVLPGRAAGE